MRWTVLALFLAACDVDDLDKPDEAKTQRCIQLSDLGGGVFDGDKFDRCMRGELDGVRALTDGGH